MGTYAGRAPKARTTAHARARTPQAHAHTLQIVLDYCPGGSVGDYMRVCRRTFEEPHIASIARYRRAATGALRVRAPPPPRAGAAPRIGIRIGDG